MSRFLIEINFIDKFIRFIKGFTKAFIPFIKKLKDSLQPYIDNAGYENLMIKN